MICVGDVATDIFMTYYFFTKEGGGNKVQDNQLVLIILSSFAS